MTELDRQLDRVARVAVLLVASDYDGTIAEIVDDPDAADPQPDAIAALRDLAALPRTHVAVISGRARADLRALTGLHGPEVHLVGSHGAEFDDDFERSLEPPVTRLRDRIETELAALAVAGEGFRIEVKPASVALHYRNADERRADEVVQTVLAGPAAMPGVFTKRGKKVVELAVVPMSKGAALVNVRRRCNASAVAFFGDDRTDEDGFGALAADDIAVKVGAGDSRATYRVDGPDAVARALERLCVLRREAVSPA